MKLLEEVGIRFLIGVFIAALIGFLFWYLVVHNETDRIVERSFQKFYNALDEACQKRATKDNPVWVSVEIPQRRFENALDEFINNVKSFLHIGGPEVSAPFRAFGDPYYKFYWEIFPPEPPYQLGQGVAESVASIFAPWSEDLPWSSNFFLTMMFDVFGFGIDILGTQPTIGYGKSVGRIVGNKINEKIVKPLLENFEGVSKIFNALDKGLDATVHYSKKGINIIVKGGKLVIKEGKFVGGVTAVYTVVCLFTTDKTLGECLKEGVIVGVAADIGKIVLEKYALPKVAERFKIFKESIKKKISLKVDDIIEFFSKDSDEVMESTEVKDLLKQKGWQWDDNVKAWKVTKESNEDIFNALEEFAKSKGNPNYYEDLIFIYDEKGNLKEVLWKSEGLKEKFSRYVTDPIKNSLGKLQAEIMGDYVLDSEGIKSISMALEDYFSKASDDEILKFFELAGEKVDDATKAREILMTKIRNLNRKADNELIFLVVERGSKLDEILGKDSFRIIVERYVKGEIDEFYLYSFFSQAYIGTIVSNNMKDEAKWLWKLLNGKTLRFSENIGKFTRGSLGYALLRIQDIYTPLGATYWDRYFSYYGYEGQRLPEGCQPSCEDGKVCVQLGACVREFDLPKSCSGIINIKLKRDSIVAPNPRFYLVSPCYSKLKIYIEGDTIFVEPHLPDPNKFDKDNYCYATGGFVNWYVGSEIGASVGRCASGALCGVLETVGTGGVGTPIAIKDIVAACFGMGKMYTTPCSIVANLVGMIFDAFRETTLIWPSAYKKLPNLIDFKIDKL